MSHWQAGLLFVLFLILSTPFRRDHRYVYNLTAYALQTNRHISHIYYTYALQTNRLPLYDDCFQINVKGQRQTGGQTGSSIQDKMLRLPGLLHWWDRQKPKPASINTNERQEMMRWTITLLNTIYRIIHNQPGLCDMHSGVFCSLLSMTYLLRWFSRTHDLLKITNIMNLQQEGRFSLWKKLVPRESAGNGAYV